MLFWSIWAPDTHVVPLHTSSQNIHQHKRQQSFLKYTYKHIECSLIVQSSFFFFSFLALKMEPLQDRQVLLPQAMPQPQDFGICLPSIFSDSRCD